MIQIDAPVIAGLVSNVFRCIGRIVTICALCCAIGLQWLALQSVAWTAMIVDYSRGGSLCQAIAKTLDGAHPCSLCKIVSGGKTAEKKSDLKVLTQKIDMICATRGTARVLLFVQFDYPTANFSVSEIRQRPSVPPPRFIAT
jgi:cyanate permease